MPTSLRDLSPFKGKPLWEPDDEEWADLDATHISSTFKASFKDPGQSSLRKATTSSTLSRFSNTITSILPSSTTKRASEARLREEEALLDKLEELNNTYYSDPTGDLHDTIMTSVFLTRTRYFPHNQSRHCVRVPHVIDLERYFTSPDPLFEAAYPRLSDAIATILSHTDKQCVESFLDPRVQEFVYRRELDRSKAGNILVIRRKGNQIVAGSYRNQGFSLSWTLYVRALFSATGLWYDSYASPVAGSSPIVDSVPEWDVFLPVNTTPSSDLSQPNTSPRKIVLASPQKTGEGEESGSISPTDEKFVLYQSRALARYLLRDVWVRFAGRCECRAVWEADGVVRGVRLKRAVVGVGEDEDEDE